MGWATVAEVKDITGETVSDRDRATAVGIIETLTGVFEGADRPDTTDRDKAWLKRAVAYQAAFVKDNPDLFSRNDVTSAGQDGQSANFRNVDAHILAPLARKAIRRLSWRQTTRKGDRASTSTRVNVLSEEYDDSLPWRPV